MSLSGSTRERVSFECTHSEPAGRSSRVSKTPIGPGKAAGVGVGDGGRGVCVGGAGVAVGGIGELAGVTGWVFAGSVAAPGCEPHPALAKAITITIRQNQFQEWLIIDFLIVVQCSFLCSVFPLKALYALDRWCDAPILPVH